MTDELHLKNYDMILMRSGWHDALEALKRDLGQGKFHINRTLVAQQFGLSPDWTWDDLQTFILDSPHPKTSFNDFLAALYRAAPLDQISSEALGSENEEEDRPHGPPSHDRLR